jgi:hypothetical protein
VLDADLAALGGVETKTPVRAVKRNLERFPEDFLFQLTKPEFDSSWSQSGTSRFWVAGERRLTLSASRA